MAALSYMQRRSSGVYEFRKRLPRSLAGLAVPPEARSQLAELINPGTGRFKRELTISLQTRDLGEAKRRDVREATRVLALIHQAEGVVRGETEPSPVPSAPLPDEIEADILSRLLAMDELEREDGDARRYLQTPEERAERFPDLTPVDFGGKGMAPGHWEILDDHVRELEGDYRKALARRDIAPIRAELHAYLREHGLLAEPSSVFYRSAGLAVLRAHVRAYGHIVERQQGEDVPTPPPGTGRGPKLSEALEEWVGRGGARGTRRPSPTSVLEARLAVRRFVDCHGDLPLGAITREMARAFRDASAQVPKNLSASQRKLPLPELLATNLRGAVTLSATTVNKHLNLLSALVSHAVTEGRMDMVAGFANPFGGVSLAVDSRYDEGDRQPFKGEHLRAIFGTDIYTSRARPMEGGGEAAFWLPLICLLSGARVSEIAQLRLCDLLEDNDTGVWLFDIGTSAGRTIKTASSRRRVPVHPGLERIGLLRYRAQLQAMSGVDLEASLWPALKSNANRGIAGPWIKWFSRFLRQKAGITDPQLVFHSFRHTFKRLARDAGLGEDVHDALTGHAGGGEGRNYGKGFGPLTLAKAISKIEEPVAIATLTWCRPPGRWT